MYQLYLQKCYRNFILFFPLLATLRHMEFPGRGSDLSHSCDLSLSCDNTRSFDLPPPNAWPWVEPVSWSRRDAAKPIKPQQKFPYFLFLHLCLSLSHTPGLCIGG